MARLSKELEAATDDEGSKTKRKAIREILAYTMSRTENSPFWKELLKQQPKETLEELESASAEYPAVTESEVSEAREVLAAAGDTRFQPAVNPEELYLIGIPVATMF